MPRSRSARAGRGRNSQRLNVTCSALIMKIAIAGGLANATVGRTGHSHSLHDGTQCDTRHAPPASPYGNCAARTQAVKNAIRTSDFDGLISRISALTMFSATNGSSFTLL
jgi:hypothetical protein